jgi:hypothetical protein
MALEKIKEQEKELKQLMIYAGRPGLWEDWQRFQAEARKSRRYAEKMAEKRREEMLHIAGWTFGIVIFVSITVAMVYTLAKWVGKI